MTLPDVGKASDAAKCAVCQHPAKHSCGACERTAYCSGDHQKQDWDSHRHNCTAYKVLRNNEVGRYGIATWTLEPGEVVLTETPVVLGPKLDSSPLCLGCYAPVDCSVLCTRCGWPVCGPDCESAPYHANAECVVFSEAGIRFQQVQDLTATCPQYECICPLRLLLVKESNPERWNKEVTLMESHNEKRRETDIWAVNQVNTVEFLRKVCKLSHRFDEELIHTACGILEVNCFEVRCASGNSVRGLYPLTAIMSHSCVANTSHSIATSGDLDNNYRLTLRTTMRVCKGKELYTSYTHSLDPTLLRRDSLRRSKYFECSCERCSDPTELGTHLGSLKCTKCDPGLVISANPLDADAKWKCTHCEFSTRGEAVLRVFTIIQSELEAIDLMEPGPEIVELREKLLRKYRGVLHHNHSFLTMLRHSLIQLYGRAEGYTLEDLPDILLERKIDLCKQILAVADVIEPGYTRVRALTLYELHAPVMLFARSRFQVGEIDDKAFRAKIEEAVAYLEEAVKILLLEEATSPEGTIGRIAEQSLVQLRESVKSLSR